MNRPFGNGAMSRNSARDGDAPCGYAPSRVARRVRRCAPVCGAVAVRVAVSGIGDRIGIDVTATGRLHAGSDDRRSTLAGAPIGRACACPEAGRVAVRRRSPEGTVSRPAGEAVVTALASRRARRLSPGSPSLWACARGRQAVARARARVAGAAVMLLVETF